MKISGFTFLRNTSKLYYPVVESILSALPIVEEFVIALGEGDKDDNTEEIINKINSNKIKIIKTKWDTKKYPRGMIHAQQTDIAKNACKGDWLLYLQGDELIHEKDYEEIIFNCKKYKANLFCRRLSFRIFIFTVVTILFQDHCWYPYEIRIIRNNNQIHSFESAQSFRKIPNFDGVNYRTNLEVQKLNVIKLNASIYHYGWVRPPKLMLKKRKYFSITHRGIKSTKHEYRKIR